MPTFTSITPETVPDSGGYKVTITGSFTRGNRHRVHIGQTATTSDPALYSGIRGQGDIIYPINATTIIGYTPILADNVIPYDVLIVDLDAATNDTGTDVLTIVVDNYHDKTYRLAAVFPPFYRTGPRSLKQIG